jgi:hypothetical protein
VSRWRSSDCSWSQLSLRSDSALADQARAPEEATRAARTDTAPSIESCLENAGYNVTDMGNPPNTSVFHLNNFADLSEILDLANKSANGGADVEGGSAGQGTAAVLTYDNASDAQAAANKAASDAQSATTNAQNSATGLAQVPTGAPVYVTNTNVVMYILATNQARTQQDIANCT